MEINTKKVTGRREVRYTSLDEFLAEARQFAQGEVRSLGNWSQGQIYQHMAQALDTSIDGAGFKLPAPMRWIFTLLMKRKFLTKSIPAGFKTSKEFTPDETSAAEGLAALETAVERQKQESVVAMHPAFGNISKQEWTDFHLRHAEMHMSFLIPV